MYRTKLELDPPLRPLLSRSACRRSRMRIGLIYWSTEFEHSARTSDWWMSCWGLPHSSGNQMNAAIAYRSQHNRNAIFHWRARAKARASSVETAVSKGESRSQQHLHICSFLSVQFTCCG